jgi:predicted neuraminidase
LNSRSSTLEIRAWASSSISLIDASSDSSIAMSKRSRLSLIASSADKKRFRNFSISVFSLLRDWDSSKLDQVDSSDNLLLISSNELSLSATSKMPPEIVHTISEIIKD